MPYSLRREASSSGNSSLARSAGQRYLLRAGPPARGTAMFSLYIFCLIIGGGLLAFSLLGGIDDADADFDVDTEIDLDADVDVETELEGDTEGPQVGGGWTPLRDFLSVRSLIYLLAGFGAAGLLLRMFTEASLAAELTVALLTGLVAAFLAGSLYGWVRSSESGIVARDNDYLVGRPAQVILAVVPGRQGKISLLADGREIQLLARLHGADDAACNRGDAVVVVDIEGDVALVTAAPSLLPDP